MDFLKKFFNFVNPNSPIDSGPKSEAYLRKLSTSLYATAFDLVTLWITERAEVYPVVLKLDYKPRRVDYRALREGRTIELMNFFHFDGAEMTLRHLTLFGVNNLFLVLYQEMTQTSYRLLDGQGFSIC